MKKLLLRISILVLCVALCMPMLSSCGNDNVYELGPYSINEEEYCYLLGMYKKKILVSMGLDESYLSRQIDSSTTYGQYLESTYRAGFEQSVIALLYSQALFDEYELELSKEQKDTVNATAKAIVHAYGDFSEKKFNKIAKEYGFSADAIATVYEKQAKESAVIQHLYGEKYSKLTETQKEDYFQENYIHFQVIVVNNLYETVTDSKGNVSYVDLTPSEKATMTQYSNELYQLFVKENKSYSYTLLKDRTDESFESFWADEKINDDKTYPNGYYMKKPENVTQIQKPTLLTTAFLLKEGDVGRLPAEKYFESAVQIGDKTYNAGDPYEYGYAYVKKLPLEKGAWKKDENKEFFEDTNFLASVAQDDFIKTLDKYDTETMYTALTNEDLVERYSLENVLANELDYYYFYGEKTEGAEEEEKQ